MGSRWAGFLVPEGQGDTASSTATALGSAQDQFAPFWGQGKESSPGQSSTASPWFCQGDVLRFQPHPCPLLWDLCGPCRGRLADSRGPSRFLELCWALFLHFLMTFRLRTGRQWQQLPSVCI